MANDIPQASVRGASVSATFRDTQFRSRVIVCPCGDVLHVLAGEVIAKGAAQVEYLDAHPDFKRLEEHG
ncbi:hypothetical protein [Burkholderia stagnalis]|uniref:hypothetical protein n=1 Tax=Burkholderia stagnalis TaxID=1503054 RepID=UPI0008417F58|nr:hypothetical protein [Burkholderia stagnalis]AOK53458.1 hypothetical protein WT74_12570 [Burkholderia stagnalis]